MSQLKKLAGETVWYGVSSILSRIINYFLTPLYTIYFIPSEFGVITEIFAYSAFLNIIYMYGMETTYFRFATKNKADSQAYFNLVVSSIIITSFIFSSILVYYAVPIMTYLGYSGYEEIVYWFAALIAIDSIVAIPFAKLRLEKQAKRFALIKLINVGVVVFLNVFFIIICPDILKGEYLSFLKPFISSFYSLDFNVKYVFLSTLLGNLIFILLLFDQFKSFKFAFDFKRFKPVIIYAAPLLLMGLAGVTNEMLSRAFLKELLPDNYYSHQTNLAALGIFGACYKLSIFMVLGNQAFRYAAEPFFFSNANDKNSPDLFSKVMLVFVAFNSIVFLVVSLNLEWLALLFLRTAEYREGLFIVPVLLMAYLFLGIFYNLSIWYKITDKTKYGALIACIGAVFTIGFNYTLIPLWGYLGSAIATLITYSSMVVMSYFIGQKYFPVPYPILKISVYLITSSIIVYILYPLDFGSLWLNFFIKNIGSLLFLIFVFFFERRNLKDKVIFGFRIP